MTYNFLDRLGVLFDPRFWGRDAPVSREYGEHLERALGQHPIRRIDAYTVMLGDVKLWVKDWPCNYGAVHPFRIGHVLPPRRTALRLRGAVLAADVGLAQ